MALWYVSLGNSVRANVYAMESSTDMADSYLEISFLNTDNVINSAATLGINIRIAKTDWSSYKQSNYINGAALYYDGVLISGYEPN